ncbi:hypothetical protein F5B20DRAFT_541684, partial [Whalleya microplaca]
MHISAVDSIPSMLISWILSNTETCGLFLLLGLYDSLFSCFSYCSLPFYPFFSLFIIPRELLCTSLLHRSYDQGKAV